MKFVITWNTVVANGHYGGTSTGLKKYHIQNEMLYFMDMP